MTPTRDHYRTATGNRAPGAAAKVKVADARTRVSYSPRFRRSIALAFAGAVVLTALVLALGSYYLVKANQQADALDGALAQSRFNLQLASSSLPASPTGEDYTALIDALAIRGDFETLILAGGQAYLSSYRVSEGLISAALQDSVDAGRLAYQEVQFTDEPALAVGGRLPEQDASLFFFYPQGEMLASLARLRSILLATGLALAVAGSLFGWWLARRILRPVDQASSAAARMAAGDLDVRLPAGKDEFGAWAASFNTMAESLQGKIADLEAAEARERRFVSDVAHELRTPIAALVGEASLVESQVKALPPGVLPAETTRALELISHDVDRLRRLIDELLEISRMDASSAEVEWADVELVDFLRRVVGAHGWGQNVILSASPQVERLVFRTDRRRLERIVVNLVENGLRHGRPVVEIDAAVADTHLILTVTDHGPGIAPLDLPYVFERFYKADPSRGASGGSGLGLAIARENARLLGGSLQAGNSSRPGWGAEFVLRLPFVSSDSDTIVTRP